LPMCHSPKTLTPARTTSAHNQSRYRRRRGERVLVGLDDQAQVDESIARPAMVRASRPFKRS
jgi:hypothetical protein